MKVALTGQAKRKIEPDVKNLGFEITDKNPEVVLAYGGDGTLMHAEHLFPGVPKVLLKGSVVCKLCLPFSNEEILKRVYEKSFTITEAMKLEVGTKDKKLFALNDVIIHNHDARHAIRYRLWINDKELGHEIIGDGIVVATPLGSTGYYRSITDSFFEVGIGLAFNNSTEQSDHMVLRENSLIKLKIIRGPADVYSDNHEESILLKDGDEVFIKKSGQIAKLIAMK